MTENKKIILDFLEKYFRFEITEEGTWAIYNLLDDPLEISRVMQELFHIFGNDNTYRELLYQWIKRKKDTLCGPIFDYLNTYRVIMDKFGWEVKKIGKNDIFNKKEYYSFFEKYYSEQILDKILEDWLYDKKMSANEKYF